MPHRCQFPSLHHTHTPPVPVVAQPSGPLQGYSCGFACCGTRQVALEDRHRTPQRLVVDGQLVDALRDGQELGSGRLDLGMERCEALR